ncbi:MAG: hypothetical protein PHG85_04930 [Candidatus Altiarchaeota archaeon]|nr:hypothetical protein [Candidatus Altiarchaeota archaeon]
METKVADASALLHTVFDLRTAKFLTTNSVAQEVLDENAKARMDAAIQAGRIVVADPDAKSMARAKGAAAETGDLPSLSKADLEVIALAFEKNAVIVTDDYAIQNTARYLGVKTEPAVQEGISREVKWARKCEGCGRIYDAGKSGPCPVCGSRLLKKAV